jgi:hypothetical protein
MNWVWKWLAAAESPPHLTAIHPQLTGADYHEGCQARAMPVPCAPNAIKSLLPHAFQDRIKAMKETPARLPESMRTLFWDVEFASIDPEHHESFIIERALEYGDDDAIRWIVRELPGRAIADTVRSSRSLSRNTGRLWSLVLGIPEGGILCLSTRSRMTPKAFSAR